MCRETELQLPKVVDPSIRQRDRRIDRPNPPKSAPASTRRLSIASRQPFADSRLLLRDAVSPSSKRAHYNQAVSSGQTAPIPSVPIDTTRSRLAQIQEQALMQYYCRFSYGFDHYSAKLNAIKRCCSWTFRSTSSGMPRREAFARLAAWPSSPPSPCSQGPQRTATGECPPILT